MKLTVVGCGDAFGSGGRLQTAYHVESSGRQFLIDCGASTLIGFQRQGLDPNRVGTILISHLHGDHFAGLVWWLLHAQHISKRTEPLVIAGPPGVEARTWAACEVFFPGSTAVKRRFALEFRECHAGRGPLDLDGMTVGVAEVSHPSGAPSHALRIVSGGRTLAFSGDTEWVDALLPVSAGADLFITECYAFDGDIRYHTTWRKLEAQLPHITARRILLTHMNASMLARRGDVSDPRIVLADDGLVLDV